MDDAGLRGQAFEFRSADRRQLLWLMSKFCGFVDMTASSCRCRRHESPDMPAKVYLADMWGCSCRPNRHSRLSCQRRPILSTSLTTLAGVYSVQGLRVEH